MERVGVLGFVSIAYLRASHQTVGNNVLQVVGLKRKRERQRRESSLVFKPGQMRGNAMPSTATAIAITPTIASTDRLCDSVGELSGFCRRNTG